MTAKMPRLNDREKRALLYVKRRNKLSAAYKGAIEERYVVSTQLDNIGKRTHPHKERLRARRSELNDIIEAYQAQLLCFENDGRDL